MFRDFMKNNFIINDTFYKSDSIKNGRRAKSFFRKLAQNLFDQSILFYEKNLSITGVKEYPLFFDERNLYSLFSVSINKITPVHLSEWTFCKDSKCKKQDSQRTVDFWCLSKNRNNGIPINYFIEVKKGYYCLTSRSNDEITKYVKNNLDVLVDQISDIKKINPDWNNFDNIYMGIAIIHNYYSNNDLFYNEYDLVNSVSANVNRVKNIQIISASYIFPESFCTDQWESNKPRSVTILGFVLSK